MSPCLGASAMLPVLPKESSMFVSLCTCLITCISAIRNNTQGTQRSIAVAVGSFKYEGAGPPENTICPQCEPDVVPPLEKVITDPAYEPCLVDFCGKLSDSIMHNGATAWNVKNRIVYLDGHAQFLSRSMSQAANDYEGCKTLKNAPNASELRKYMGDAADAGYKLDWQDPPLHFKDCVYIAICRSFWKVRDSSSPIRPVDEEVCYKEQIQTEDASTRYDESFFLRSGCSFRLSVFSLYVVLAAVLRSSQRPF
mmetsp:Transcript_49240/g.86673  ORF Transcript_49240/g.86673 Transcript_49240/m.86673 type:complete len:253 (+) Transcript_49240:51-809(+)